MELLNFHILDDKIFELFQTLHALKILKFLKNLSFRHGFPQKKQNRPDKARRFLIKITHTISSRLPDFCR